MYIPNSYMITAHVCCRYIWGYRTQLAQSVHDLSKQMYDSKQYARAAWKPLSDWLHAKKLSPTESDRRQWTLTKFNKKSQQFHRVVAACLWNLATGANLPWGRGTVRPDVYSAIPPHEKVVKWWNRHLVVMVFFF